MSLADDLPALPDKYATDKCHLRAWADTLPERDATALWAAVYDPARTLSVVADLITRNGHEVSASTIRHHRAGICSTCRRRRAA